MRTFQTMPGAVRVSLGGEPTPLYARPQDTCDDLVAEFKAWVLGEQDGHDQVIQQIRRGFWGDERPTKTRAELLQEIRCPS